MKKITLTIAALSVLALFAPAARAAGDTVVYSANVVGYTKVPIEPGKLTMLGVQFTEVGGAPKAINDLFIEAVVDTLGGAGTDSTADVLRVWDAGKQEYDQYWFADWKAYPGYDRKWYVLGEFLEPTDDVVTPSSAAWYISKSSTPASILFHGEVITTNVTVKLKGAPAITMIANPYPAPLSLSDVSDIGSVNWVGSALVGTGADSSADILRVWNAKEQKYDQYWFADWGNYPGYDRKWYVLGEFSTPTTGFIPVGGAAWYVPKATTSDVNLLLVAPPGL